MNKQDSIIFLSYARVDKTFAQRLSQDLKNAGYKVWVDQLQIKVSQKWANEIQKALTEAGSLVFIMSEASIHSQNVLDEVYYALDNNKPVIPLLLRDCEIPYRVHSMQYISFIDDYDTGLNELLDSLDMQSQASIPGATKQARKNTPKKKLNLFQTIFMIVFIIMFVLILVNFIRMMIRNPLF